MSGVKRFYLVTEPEKPGASSGMWFTNSLSRLFDEVAKMCRAMEDGTLKCASCDEMADTIKAMFPEAFDTISFKGAKEMHRRSCGEVGYCLRMASPRLSSPGVDWGDEGITMATWEAPERCDVDALKLALLKKGAKYVKMESGDSAEEVLFRVMGKGR